MMMVGVGDCDGDFKRSSSQIDKHIALNHHDPNIVVFSELHGQQSHLVHHIYVARNFCLCQQQGSYHHRHHHANTMTRRSTTVESRSKPEAEAETSMNMKVISEMKHCGSLSSDAQGTPWTFKCKEQEQLQQQQQQEQRHQHGVMNEYITVTMTATATATNLTE